MGPVESNSDPFGKGAGPDSQRVGVYIIGDFEDSDLCLRLREAGAGIAYVPEAELFHFERRSIRLHAGYSDTLASLYNRRLHHRRWDGAIAALMARRTHRVAA